ncbi:vanadium-dependent haloperoxidase [Mucilaginibacter sp.]|uniref:vanadium-dependent haloperoxidase n=1 Tax=Mucilaginibacter sp. TaxID=1882438 RepID=UPI00284F41D4|nr:vanadium-dependent haloperoxidase [Mucilaginibacter sp.]MDR3695925.1 vanadium-dependent haloperoxidase [Mucilaginibacter sp.]
MMTYLKKLIFFSFLVLAQYCFAQAPEKAFPDYLQPNHAINAVTMVMIHDVTSPPVAARYYAYCMQGAYNIVSINNKNIPPLQRFIKGFTPDGSLDTIHEKYDYRIASYYSIMEIARQLLPSGFMLKDDEDNFIYLLQKTGIPQAVIDNSVKVAKLATVQIVNFSKADHYNKLSTLKRYTPLKGDAYWYPTPPGYFEAVEPHWKTIRPMMIDSANQFRPLALTPFSTDSTSVFFKHAKDVYDTSKHLTTEQVEIALFWDCNPFAITTSGHMMIGYKKITPGGHWMNVTGLACKQAHLSFDQSIMVLTIEGSTLMDAFISSWDAKYQDNRIRPETYINRYIDVNWRPILQTPPFPEFTSAHSVVSNASAELLTYLLGDKFAYTDVTEIPFGSGQRSFKSFRQASDEASVSRFYGGIHYLESVNSGVTEGKMVGADIISKIKKAGVLPLTGNYRPK